MYKNKNSVYILNCKQLEITICSCVSNNISLMQSNLRYI